MTKALTFTPPVAIAYAARQQQTRKTIAPIFTNFVFTTKRALLQGYPGGTKHVALLTH
jgi:hypothetical protein